MAPSSIEREIDSLQYKIRLEREETYVGRLVGGIIMTVLGVTAGLTCISILLSISGIRSRYVSSTRGWSVFILIVSIIFIIIGIVLIRSFVEARAERSRSINYMTDQIQNLRMKMTQPQVRSNASSGSSSEISGNALSRAVNLGNGRWRCVCGRENEAYVGTCACGRTRAGINKAKAEQKKRLEAQAEAEKKQKEQEAEEKRQKEAQEKAIQQKKADMVNFAALRELKGLLDDGIITQEEFDRKKKIYLGDAVEGEDITPAVPAPVKASAQVMKPSPAQAAAPASALSPAGTSAPAGEPVKDDAAPEPQKMRVCPNCGASCMPEAVFCRNCGLRL